MTSGELYAAVFAYVLGAKNDPDLLAEQPVRGAVQQALAALENLVNVVERLPDGEV